MTAPDPGRVLRRALVAWGLGHLVMGHRRLAHGLLLAELLSALTIGWLSIGLADTSLSVSYTHLTLPTKRIV